jgi:hypothetical protein
MDMTNLVVLVKQMRDAQMAYFKTRGSAHLRESKRLEKELDAVIDVIMGEAAFASGGQEWADWNASMLDFGD